MQEQTSHNDHHHNNDHASMAMSTTTTITMSTNMMAKRDLDTSMARSMPTSIAIAQVCVRCKFPLQECSSWQPSRDHPHIWGKLFCNFE